MTPNDPPLAQRDPDLAPAAPVCPVCGDPHRHRTGLEPSSPYLDGASYHIARCAGCGLLQTQPWPTPELLRQVYDSGNYYSTVEASATGTPNQPLIERARSAVRSLVVRHHFAAGGAGLQGRLASLVARRRFGWGPPGLSPGKLLDVGCGDGAFLLDAREAEWQVTGIETSQVAVENAGRLGLNVLAGSLEDHPFGPAEFDVVRLWSVLEHVPDAGLALGEIAKLLRPGGWAILQVPNAGGFTARLTGSRWPGWDVPAHLVHFTRATFERAVRAGGMLPMEIHSCSVGTMTGRHPWLASTPGRVAVFAMDQLFDLLGGGDTLMMFARKPLDPRSGEGSAARTAYQPASCVKSQ